MTTDAKSLSGKYMPQVIILRCEMALNGVEGEFTYRFPLDIWDSIGEEQREALRDGVRWELAKIVIDQLDPPITETRPSTTNADEFVKSAENALDLRSRT